MTDFLISYKPITGIIAGGFPGGSEGKESAYSAGVVLEKTLESPLDSKGIQPVHPKGNQS